MTVEVCLKVLFCFWTRITFKLGKIGVELAIFTAVAAAENVSDKRVRSEEEELATFESIFQTEKRR